MARENTMTTTTTFTAALSAGPQDLTSYDIIVVSTSGGKDSQTTARVVAELAREAGVLDRVVAVHSDLGKAVEWPDAPEVAERQMTANGIDRFIRTSRLGKTAQKDGKQYAKGETFGDLLDFAERRSIALQSEGKVGGWPSKSVRYCTGEFKTSPINVVLTGLAREWKLATGIKTRPCRILDCQGIRAEESRDRAKKTPFSVRRSNKNLHIDTWYPIHAWTEVDVWTDILDSGIEHHSAYDAGSRRLSCLCCIFSSEEDLMVAASANPDQFDKWATTEERIEHSLRPSKSWDEAVEKGKTLRAIQAKLAERPELGLLPPRWKTVLGGDYTPATACSPDAADSDAVVDALAELL
jgi:3'-phosphoadenosine 5'-phosphosulfate sulfotransferase (PAPS reductase)/FAD synthetase